MKYKYRFHCSPNAIRNSEILYQDMATKGFRLVKRGILFSKFVPDTKKELCFQLLVYTTIPTGKTKHQIETRKRRSEQYKTLKGWTYVTRRGPVFVLCTRKTEELPTYYHSEEEVEKAYHSRAKSFFRVMLSGLFLFVMGNIASFVMAPSIFRAISYSLSNLAIACIVYPFLFVTILCAILETCYEQIIFKQECKDFEHELTKLSGNVPDIRERALPVRIGSTFIFSLLIISIGLFMFSMFEPKLHKVNLSEAVPFLTIRDFKDSNKQKLLSYKEQTATYNNSFLCTYYNVKEDATEDGQFDFYLNEDFYHVKFDGISHLLMRCLLYTKPLYLDTVPEQVFVDGLDEAYQVKSSPNSTDVYLYIARKGTKMLRIHCSNLSLTGFDKENLDKANEIIWANIVETLSKKD